MTEEELCTRVVAWLERRQWSVLQEVQMGTRTIDIVAQLGKKTWAIEAKLRPSLEVLSQANDVRGATHLVSIATVSASDSFRKVAAALGLGLLLLGDEVVEALSPMSNAPNPLRSMQEIEARPEDVNGRAGAQHGRARQAMPHRLRDYLDGGPCSIDQAIAITFNHEACFKTRHVYRSRLGQYAGIQIVGRGKNARVYLEVE